MSESALSGRCCVSSNSRRAVVPSMVRLSNLCVPACLTHCFAAVFGPGSPSQPMFVLHIWHEKDALDSQVVCGQAGCAGLRSANAELAPLTAQIEERLLGWMSLLWALARWERRSR